MGASREMYQDEKIAQGIHTALPNLMTLLWANHSYQNEAMFKEEILERIQTLRENLDLLEQEVKQGPTK